MREKLKKLLSLVLTFTIIITGIQPPQKIFALTDDEINNTLAYSYYAPDEENGDKNKTMYITKSNNKLLIYGDLWRITDEIVYNNGKYNEYADTKADYYYTDEPVVIPFKTDGYSNLESFCVKVDVSSTNPGYYNRGVYFTYNSMIYGAMIDTNYQSKAAYCDCPFSYGFYNGLSSLGYPDNAIYELKGLSSKRLCDVSTGIRSSFYLNDQKFYVGYDDIMDQGYIYDSNATALDYADNDSKNAFTPNGSTLSKAYIKVLSEDTFYIAYVKSSYDIVGVKYQINSNNKLELIETNTVYDPSDYIFSDNISNAGYFADGSDLYRINDDFTVTLVTSDLSSNSLKDSAYQKDGKLYNFKGEEITYRLVPELITYDVKAYNFASYINFTFDDYCTKVIAPDNKTYKNDFAYEAKESGLYSFEVTAKNGDVCTLVVPVTVKSPNEFEVSKPSVAVLNNQITMLGDKEILLSDDGLNNWTPYTAPFEYTDSFYVKYNEPESIIIYVEVTDGKLSVSETIKDEPKADCLANLFYITDKGTLKALFPDDPFMNQMFNMSKSGYLMDKNNNIISDVVMAYTRLKQYATDADTELIYEKDGEGNITGVTSGRKKLGPDAGVYSYVDSEGNILSTDYKFFAYDKGSVKERWGLTNIIDMIYDNGFSYLIGDTGKTVKIEDKFDTGTSGWVNVAGSISEIAANGAGFSSSSLKLADNSEIALDDNGDMTFKVEDGKIYQYNSSLNAWEETDVSSLVGHYNTISTLAMPDKTQLDNKKINSNVKYRSLKLLKSYATYSKTGVSYDTLKDMFYQEYHIQNNKQFIYDYNTDTQKYETYNDSYEKTKIDMSAVLGNVKDYVASHPEMVMDVNDVIAGKYGTVGYNNTVTVKIPEINTSASTKKYYVIITDENGENPIVKETDSTRLSESGLRLDADELSEKFSSKIAFTIAEESSEMYKSDRRMLTHNTIRFDASTVDDYNQFDPLIKRKYESENDFYYTGATTTDKGYRALFDNDYVYYYDYIHEIANVNEVSQEDLITDNGIQTTKFISTRDNRASDNGLQGTADGDTFKISLTSQAAIGVTLHDSTVGNIWDIKVFDSDKNEVASFNNAYIESLPVNADDNKVLRTGLLDYGDYTIKICSTDGYIKSIETLQFIEDPSDVDSVPYFIGCTKYTDDSISYEGEYGTEYLPDTYVFLDNEGYLYKLESSYGSNTWENTKHKITTSDTTGKYNVNNTNWTNKPVKISVENNTYTEMFVKLLKDNTLLKDITLDNSDGLTESAKFFRLIESLKDTGLDVIGSDEYNSATVYLNGEDKSDDYEALLQYIFEANPGFDGAVIQDISTYTNKYITKDFTELSDQSELESYGWTGDNYLQYIDVKTNAGTVTGINMVGYSDTYSYYYNKYMDEYFSSDDVIWTKKTIGFHSDSSAKTLNYTYCNNGTVESISALNGNSIPEIELTSNGTYTLVDETSEAVGYNKVIISNIDRLAPSCNATFDGSAFKLTGTDADATDTDGQSGVKTFEYRLAVLENGSFVPSGEWMLYNSESIVYDPDAATEITADTITTNMPVIYARCYDYAGNVSKEELIDLNGLLGMQGTPVYENGKTTVTFYGTDLSDAYVKDENEISFKYTVTNNGNTLVNNETAQNDTISYKGENITLDQTTLEFTDETIGEFNVKSVANKMSAYGFNKKGSDSKDLVVVTVDAPEAVGGESLSLEEGDIVNDNLDKMYFRYYNKADKSSFTTETFEEYTDEVDLPYGDYKVETYEVSSYRMVRSSRQLYDVTLSAEPLNVTATPNYENGKTTVTYNITNKTDGVTYNYDYKVNNISKDGEDNKISITQDSNIKCSISGTDGSSAETDEDYKVIKSDKPVIGDVPVNGSTVTVEAGAIVNDTLESLTVTVDGVAAPVVNGKVSMEPGTHTVVATQKTTTHGFITTQTKDVYVSDFEIRYKLTHTNGSTKINIFDKNDTDASANNYFITVDGTKENISEKTLTSDTIVTIREEDAYGNYDEKDVDILVIKSDLPTISEPDSNHMITVTAGDVENGTFKGLVASIDNESFHTYTDEEIIICMEEGPHHIEAYQIVEPAQKTDEDETVDTDTTEKDVEIYNLNIKDEYVYENGKTSVTFRDEKEGNYTYSYTIGGNKTSGNAFDVKEDTSVTLTEKDEYGYVKTKDADVIVVKSDNPVIGDVPVNGSTVTVEAGAIVNDTLESLTVTVDGVAAPIVNGKVSMEPGTHTVVATQKTATHGFITTQIKDVYVSDLEIRYKLTHTNGSTKINIFDKNDTDASINNYSFIIKGETIASSETSVTEDTSVTIKETDAYNNFDEDDINVKVTKSDLPVISDLSSDHKVTVSAGNVINGTLKALMVSVDNKEYKAYAEESAVLELDESRHIIKAYQVVVPDQKTDDTETFNTSVVEKEVNVYNLDIAHNCVYENGKTSVAFRDVKDGNYTYSYTIDGTTVDGNTFDVTEDTNVTLREKDEYGFEKTKDVFIKVIKSDKPVIGALGVNKTSVSVKAGVIANDELLSLKVYVDGNEVLLENGRAELPEGRHTVKAVQVTKDYSFETVSEKTFDIVILDVTSDVKHFNNRTDVTLSDKKVNNEVTFAIIDSNETKTGDKHSFTEDKTIIIKDTHKNGNYSEKTLNVTVSSVEKPIFSINEKTVTVRNGAVKNSVNEVLMVSVDEGEFREYTSGIELSSGRHLLKAYTIITPLNASGAETIISETAEKEYIIEEEATTEELTSKETTAEETTTEETTTEKTTTEETTTEETTTEETTTEETTTEETTTEETTTEKTTTEEITTEEATTNPETTIVVEETTEPETITNETEPVEETTEEYPSEDPSVIKDENKPTEDTSEANKPVEHPKTGDKGYSKYFFLAILSGTAFAVLHARKREEEIKK